MMEVTRLSEETLEAHNREYRLDAAIVDARELNRTKIFHATEEDQLAGSRFTHGENPIEQ